jgi:hypothetical protein
MYFSKENICFPFLVIGQINDDTTGVNINKIETFYVVVKIKYSNPLHKEENDNRVA